MVKMFLEMPATRKDIQEKIADIFKDAQDSTPNIIEDNNVNINQPKSQSANTNQTESVVNVDIPTSNKNPNVATNLNNSSLMENSRPKRERDKETKLVWILELLI